ncbi:MAG: hypothetical protein IJY36_02785 [Coprobacter sp.]|nr:hypothetical protein [Coprobacter sp.]
MIIFILPGWILLVIIGALIFGWSIKQLVKIALFPFFPFFISYDTRNKDSEESKRLLKFTSILYAIAALLGVLLYYRTKEPAAAIILYNPQNEMFGDIKTKGVLS